MQFIQNIDYIKETKDNMTNIQAQCIYIDTELNMCRGVWQGRIILQNNLKMWLIELEYL